MTINDLNIQNLNLKLKGQCTIIITMYSGTSDAGIAVLRLYSGFLLRTCDVRKKVTVWKRGVGGIQHKTTPTTSSDQ